MSMERTWDDVWRALDSAWTVRDPDRRIWKSCLANHAAAEVVDAVLTWDGPRPPRPTEIRAVLLGTPGRGRAFQWGVREVQQIIDLDPEYATGFFDRARQGLQVLTPAARRRFASHLRDPDLTTEAVPVNP